MLMFCPVYIKRLALYERLQAVFQHCDDLIRLLFLKYLMCSQITVLFAEFGGFFGVLPLAVKGCDSTAPKGHAHVLFDSVRKFS